MTFAAVYTGPAGRVAFVFRAASRADIERMIEEQSRAGLELVRVFRLGRLT